MGASVRPDIDALIAERRKAAETQQASPDLDKLIAERRAATAAASGTQPRSTVYNAINTFDNALTFGLGQKFNAGFNALGDLIRGRDSFTHSYTKNLEAEHAGLEDFRARHPIASASASGIGGGLGAVAAAPLAGASELATGLSMGKRALDAARVGGALSSVAALGNAPNNGSVAENVGRAAIAGGAGAVLSAASVPATEAIGSLARRTGPVLRRFAAGDDATAPAMTRVTNRAADVAQEGAAVAPSAPDENDPATRVLLKRLERTGLTPQQAIDRLEQIPLEKPVTVMEVAGDRSHPVRQLGKLVARSQSAGSAELRAAMNERAEPLTNAQRVLGDVGEAMGVERTNSIENAEALVAKRKLLAQPHYDAAEQTAPIPLGMQLDETTPTLEELLRRPSVRSAVKFHNEVAAERGEPALKVPELPEGERPRVPIRHADGRLRADLSKVSDDDLQAEFTRLHEMNAAEEAMHGAIQEQNYRGDYYELPETERLGKRGGVRRGTDGRMRQEDLPDADGMVDPDKLASDNKIVADYNKSIIVRAARQKAMDRLNAEMQRRPSMQLDDSFDWHGGTDTAPKKPQEAVPLKSLQLIKFKLDEMLDFAKTNGRLPDGSAATNAKLDAINETRRSLLDIMGAHSPEYAKANEIWSGESALLDAAKTGRKFFAAPIDEVQSKVGEMTPGEREQHNVSALSGPIRDRLFKTSAVDRAKILNGPDVQERLQAVVPPERLSVLRRKADVEHQIALTHQAIGGGSDTAENMLNQLDASQIVDPLKVGTNVVAHGPRHAAMEMFRHAMESRIAARLQGINETTADALAPKLTAGIRSRAEAKALLEDLATAFDRAQRRRGSLPFAGTATGSVTGQLISRPSISSQR